MDKREKVEFILEQIRLGLAKKDFVRTQIISRKISSKFLALEENEVNLSNIANDAYSQIFVGFETWISSFDDRIISSIQ